MLKEKRRGSDDHLDGPARRRGPARHRCGPCRRRAHAVAPARVGADIIANDLPARVASITSCEPARIAETVSLVEALGQADRATTFRSVRSVDTWCTRSRRRCRTWARARRSSPPDRWHRCNPERSARPNPAPVAAARHTPRERWPGSGTIARSSSVRAQSGSTRCTRARWPPAAAQRGQVPAVPVRSGRTGAQRPELRPFRTHHTPAGRAIHRRRWGPRPS